MENRILGKPCHIKCSNHSCQYTKDVACNLGGIPDCDGVTIVCSLLGFVAGYIDSSGIEILVDSVRNKQQFIQVQTMHNFTYMGSILGMLAALFWHFYRRKIQRY
jgi:hypothetical protein